jgi:hypothetical protein
MVAALFGGLVFAPVCAYFVLFAPDWALFYLVDSRAVPSALLLLLVVADACAVVLGFWAAYRAARARSDRTLVALGATPAAAAGAIVVAFLAPLRVDGTFQQVSAGFGTRGVAGGPLGWSVLWMSAMIAAGAVISGQALDNRNRLSSATPPAGDAPAAGSTAKRLGPRSPPDRS